MALPADVRSSIDFWRVCFRLFLKLKLNVYVWLRAFAVLYIVIITWAYMGQWMVNKMLFVRDK